MLPNRLSNSFGESTCAGSSRSTRSSTAACVRNYVPPENQKFEGPVKAWIGPLAKLIIIANKKVVQDVADGGSCASYYPVNCTDPANPTYDSCEPGLIACNKKTGDCPAFFQAGAAFSDLSGWNRLARQVAREREPR